MPGSRSQSAYLSLTMGDLADFCWMLACSQLVPVKRSQAACLNCSRDIGRESVVFQMVACSRMALTYPGRLVLSLKKEPTRMVRIFVALLMPMCCIIVSFFFCRPWCLQHQMDDRLLDTAIV
jgi:hypothetical protein